MDRPPITWNHKNPGKRNREARRAAASTEFESRNRAIVDITTAALSALGQPVQHFQTPVINHYTSYQDRSTQQDQPIQQEEASAPEYPSQQSSFTEPAQENVAADASFYDAYVHPANSPINFQENLSDTHSIATIADADISSCYVGAVGETEEVQGTQPRQEA